MIPTNIFPLIIASLSTAVQGTTVNVQHRAPPVPTPSFFVPGVKWQIEIDTAVDTEGTTPIVPQDAKVWDVNLYDETDKDTTENPPDENGIARLRAVQDGTIFVICYFNAGGVEPADEENPSRLPDSVILGDIPLWLGEHYIDITSDIVLNFSKAIIDRGVAGGCDAFDPDNIDGYQEPTLVQRKSDGHVLNETDYYNYVKAISDYAHSKDKLIGQKNAPELLDLSTFDGTSRGLLKDGITDFAVTESCSGKNGEAPWCELMSVYVEANKPVLQIEYPSEWDGTCTPTALSNTANYCNLEGASGFSTILKLDGDDCGLDGYTQYCGMTQLVITPTES
ncbi:hypothetical protein PFICI_14005 [Pestalotiopsis fici W106-1]|uniref:alpha-galactosidase n=1 Tax=Pestalotiopsis fici (strain W106-1 / CGMCC3.15140) TaxID=1229662 RepID=W3WK34_PESFW|nr:uncharacterized protein PFICI_14005 [Pestalotiopsis fici W106-1]ETS74139.1 hypothetical protein PFICI_14005 [Pestalotiopsis fici W106-1]